MWDIRPEKCEKVTLALRKNLEFQLYSPKTGQRKILGQWKFQPQSITTLSMQTRSKQADNTNAFVEKERQI